MPQKSLATFNGVCKCLNNRRNSYHMVSHHLCVHRCYPRWRPDDVARRLHYNFISSCVFELRQQTLKLVTRAWREKNNIAVKNTGVYKITSKYHFFPQGTTNAIFRICCESLGSKLFLLCVWYFPILAPLVALHKMHKTKRYNQVVYTFLPSILGDPVTDHDIFPDETRFHISVSINRHNCRVSGRL